MSVAWGAVQEQLGTVLLPIFEKVAGFLAEHLPGVIATAQEWLGRLMPVFEVLGAIVGFQVQVMIRVWQTVVTVIQGAVAVISAIISGAIVAWNAIWSGIEAIVGFLQTYVIGPIVFAVTAFSTTISTLIGGLVTGVITVWNGIVAVWDFLRDNVIGPIIFGVTAFATTIELIVAGIVGAVKNVWGGLVAVWEFFRDSVVQPIWDKVIELKDHIVGIFEAAVEGVKWAWNLLTGVVKAPIKLAVGFYNAGIAKPWNAIISKIPGVGNLPEVDVSNWNSGGRLPGYGTRDTVPAMLTPGEFVVNARATRVTEARAPGLLEWLNSGGMRDTADPGIFGFAHGGLVGRIYEDDPRIPSRSRSGARMLDFNGRTGTVSYRDGSIFNLSSLHWAGSSGRRRPMFRSWAERMAWQRGDQNWRNAGRARGALPGFGGPRSDDTPADVRGRRMGLNRPVFANWAERVADFSRHNAGGLVQMLAGGGWARTPGQAMGWANAQVGKPYQWPSRGPTTGPGSYDCSGFTSALINYILGQNPYSRRHSSSSVGGDPAVTRGVGPIGGLNIGARSAFMRNKFGQSVGHIAVTLGGTNYEATPPRVRKGPGAKGYANFPNRYHLAGFGTGAIPVATGGDFLGASGEAVAEVADPGIVAAILSFFNLKPPQIEGFFGDLLTKSLAILPRKIFDFLMGKLPQLFVDAVKALLPGGGTSSGTQPGRTEFGGPRPPSIAGLMDGGSVRGNGPVLVGEHRPELAWGSWHQYVQAMIGEGAGHAGTVVEGDIITADWHDAIRELDRREWRARQARRREIERTAPR